jgi:hypothetical protein
VPLDAPPLDLSAIRQGVDRFFADLAEYASSGGVAAPLPIVPAVVVMTALAYECGRRWRAKAAATVPPAEDPVGDLSEEQS